MAESFLLQNNATRSNVMTSWLKDIVVVFAFTMLLYSIFLGCRPLTPPDEGRYSEIPREMLVSGDYITPHLNGIKYFEKPALFYWLQAASIKTFGTSEWSLRLMTALMGSLGCLLTYWGARRLYNRRVGLLSSLILGTSILYAGLAHFITLDMTLTTLLTGSFLLFLIANQVQNKSRKYYLWGMYACAALATLTKGLIGVILPSMIIFVWLCFCRKWKELPTYVLISGTCLFFAIVLPWHIAVQLKNPEFFHFYFVEQHFLRYFTSYASREQPLWFLPIALLGGFFPWTGFLIPALEKQFRLWKGHLLNPKEIFLLLWATLIFFFYWLSHSQLLPYILPVFPPLAIITAFYLDQQWDKRSRGVTFGFGLAVTISFLLAIGLTFYLRHNAISAYISKWTLISTLGILVCSALCALLCYLRGNIKAGLFWLLFSIINLILMVNFSYGPFETRSTKVLAQKFLEVAQPTQTLYTYHAYYQDLPVYLNRTVKVVSWEGELFFGSQHQDTKQFFATEQELWQDWSKPQRAFMILKLSDYDNLIMSNYKLYPILKTNRNILVSNQELKT